MDKELILPLRDLIGVPIMDLVYAEGQAAQASVEVIQNVGFRNPKDEDHFGELRHVTFSYAIPTRPGEKEKREFSVPLLSLIPLPILQIDKSEIEFIARIVGVKAVNVESAVKSSKKTESLHEKRNEFIAVVDSLSPETQKTAEPRIKFKIEVKQSDLPAGVVSLLQKLDKSVLDS